jgi:lysylphosphatidylglycerol synthetase-like protein (DUF2156 family)
MRRKITALIALFTALSAPLLVAASDITDKLMTAGRNAGYGTAAGESGILTTIGLIINIALSVLGVVFLVLIVYAGYLWMTAGGDESNVEKAKQTIGRAVIGLVIVVCAYAIANFVVPQIYCASNPDVTECSEDSLMMH